MSENLIYLKKVPFFSALSDEELTQIGKIVKDKAFAKGTTVFLEGQPGDAIYFVKSGTVKLSKIAPDGRELIVHIFGPGNVFAEITLFHSHAYPVTCVVMEDTVLGVIMNDDLETLVETNGKMALSIIKILNQHLWTLQTKLTQMVFGNVESKTAELLLQLYREHGAEHKKGHIITVPLSRQELANMAGTTRESMSRTLSKWKKDGIIELQGKKIIICDLTTLKMYLEENNL